MIPPPAHLDLLLMALASSWLDMILAEQVDPGVADGNDAYIQTVGDHHHDSEENIVLTIITWIVVVLYS